MSSGFHLHMIHNLHVYYMYTWYSNFMTCHETRKIGFKNAILATSYHVESLGDGLCRWCIVVIIVIVSCPILQGSKRRSFASPADKCDKKIQETSRNTWQSPILPEICSYITCFPRGNAVPTTGFEGHHQITSVEAPVAPVGAICLRQGRMQNFRKKQKKQPNMLPLLIHQIII